MKGRNQRRMNSAMSFRANEHLWVQKEIEKRAHELWQAGGFPPMASLDYWLQAEREMLEKLLPTLFERGKSRSFRNNASQFTEERFGAAGKRPGSLKLTSPTTPKPKKERLA